MRPHSKNFLTQNFKNKIQMKTKRNLFYGALLFLSTMMLLSCEEESAELHVAHNDEDAIFAKLDEQSAAFIEGLSDLELPDMVGEVDPGRITSTGMTNIHVDELPQGNVLGIETWGSTDNWFWPNSFRAWKGYSGFLPGYSGSNINSNSFYKMNSFSYNTSSGVNTRVRFEHHPISDLQYQNDRLYAFEVFQKTSSGWQRLYRKDGKCERLDGSWIQLTAEDTFQIPEKSKWYLIIQWGYTNHPGEGFWRSMSSIQFFH